MGVVGYHPAKLPKNRGRHPLIWALVLGLEKSASTFFFMDEGADTGDILSQVDFKISYQDDARSIYNKVVNIALFQIEEFIPKLEENVFKRVKQSDQYSNVWRRRNEPDGQIDFRMSSRSIYNLTRALTKPYVGAHIKYNGKNISIWKVKEIDDFRENIEPGKVLKTSDKFFIVKSSDGAIEVTEHDFKAPPKIGEYL
jgi:methionyl-tRNA formyltransferase